MQTYSNFMVLRSLNRILPKVGDEGPHQGLVKLSLSNNPPAGSLKADHAEVAPKTTETTLRRPVGGPIPDFSIPNTMMSLLI